MKFIKIFIIIAMTLLIMSCQATPDTAPVIGKNGTDNFVNSNSSVNIEHYDSPERWEDIFIYDNSNLTVNINASISVQNGYPLSAYAAPMVISQNLADKLLDYFIGEAAIYKTTEQMTKSEIEQEIVNLQLAKQKSSENTNPDKADEDYYDYLIGYWQEIWASAPETRDKTEIERKLLPLSPPESSIAPILKSPDQTDEEYLEDVEQNEKYVEQQIEYYNENFTGIEGYANDADGSTIYISIVNDKNFSQTEVVIKNKDAIRTDKDPYSETLNNVIITLNGATKIAEDFLTQMNIDSMDIIFIEAGEIVQRGKEKAEDKECYILHYGKATDGFSETYETSSGMNSQSYSEYRKYERMSFYIDDSGIFNFEWTNPLEINETVLQTPALLDFLEIQSIFEQQVKYANVWDDDEKMVERIFVVDTIELGLMRINIKDNSEEYLLVPVWDFFGYEIYQYNSQEDTKYVLDENKQCTMDRGRQSFITISAIDGSVIDRGLGY